MMDWDGKGEEVEEVEEGESTAAVVVGARRSAPPRIKPIHAIEMSSQNHHCSLLLLHLLFLLRSILILQSNDNTILHPIMFKGGDSNIPSFGGSRFIFLQHRLNPF